MRENLPFWKVIRVAFYLAIDSQQCTKPFSGNGIPAVILAVFPVTAKVLFALLFIISSIWFFSACILWHHSALLTLDLWLLEWRWKDSASHIFLPCYVHHHSSCIQSTLVYQFKRSFSYVCVNSVEEEMYICNPLGYSNLIDGSVIC